MLAAVVEAGSVEGASFVDVDEAGVVAVVAIGKTITIKRRRSAVLGVLFVLGSLVGFRVQ